MLCFTIAKVQGISAIHPYFLELCLGELQALARPLLSVLTFDSLWAGMPLEAGHHCQALLFFKKGYTQV